MWGSTFDPTTKKWGYKCCLCYDKDATRCLGEVGRMKVIKARDEAEKKAREEKEAEERKEKADSDSSDDESDSSSSSLEDSDASAASVKARRKRKRDKKAADKTTEKLDRQKVEMHLKSLETKTKDQIQSFTLD